MATAVWIILALVVLFGVALFSRFRHVRPASREKKDRTPQPLWPRVEPLKPGESYDTTVKLATLPNVPVAELCRQRLREQGIEAFLKGGSPYAVDGFGGIPNMSPNLPAEVWVGRHDLERALEIIHEFE